jgi:hypothetical protein
VSRRQEICASEGIGLTTLYNQCDDGAWADLMDLHRELDLAVLGAYGWDDLQPGQQVEINHRLFALNAEIIGGRVAYDGPRGRSDDGS